MKQYKTQHKMLRQSGLMSKKNKKGLFSATPLAMAVSLAMMATLGLAPATQVHATDLDIYQGPIQVGGETSVMMLFDVSNNMGGTDSPSNWKFPYPSKTDVIPAGSKPVIAGAVSEFGDNDTVYDFPRYYQIDTNGKFYYRRIDKLKMSLYHILNIQAMKGVDAKPLSDKLSFGISLTPSLDNDNTTLDKRYSSQKGYILVPAKPLNYLYPGTKVQSTMPMNDVERNNIRKANLPIANPLSVYAGWTQKDRLHDAIRRIEVEAFGGRGSYNPLAIGIMETSAYLLGTRTDQLINGYADDQFSGMSLSASDSKLDNGYYNAPEAQGATCSSAKGLFVLSSGPGNVQNVNIANLSKFAKKTIDYEYSSNTTASDPFLSCNSQNYGKATSVGNDGNSYSLTYSSDQDVQWMCGLPMTRVLRGHNYTYNPGYKNPYDLFGENYKNIPTLANKKMNILTGVVGFGSEMSTYKNAPKVKRYDQNGREVLAQDCSRSKLASLFGENMSGAIKYQNFCMLGAETYNWGEGGLYTADDPAEVADALNSFIAKIATTTDDLPAISTGTMSVPFDSLNQLTPRTNAYIPILDPRVNTTKLWPGNLKKYDIRSGTIKDGDNKFVFTSREGYFAKDTKDNWNTSTVADKAQPQVGGSFSQILRNVASPQPKKRVLYVDNGSSLALLEINGSSPNGFDGLNWNSVSKVAQDSKELQEINALLGSSDTAKQQSGQEKISQRAKEMKNQLVNFLGFPVVGVDVVDNKVLTDSQGDTITATESNRILGGVLHSRPQLVTYSAQLDSSGAVKQKQENGKTVSEREDYLLYGSFDGALHLINDKNGEEVFNFIPRQVLQRQGKAFVPAQKDSLGDPKSAPFLHGVDAEWEVYADYKRTINGSNYGIQAKDIFAFGGLRMGGSMYYGLNITDKTSPKMLYSIGSNYALSIGQNNSFNIIGEKNGQEDNSYVRMGLTWAKPTVAYVKQGGKRVMVNFLSGGYDECYEDPHFQLNTDTNKLARCNNKASAQGNAVYMVKVGEEETSSTDNQKSIKTDGVSDIGDTLWWASSDATGANSQRVPDMKHSIVSQVLALDGNYDGLTDHLYFSDLGGQVWRVDINNDKDTDDFSIQRVVKVFSAEADAVTKNITENNSTKEVTYSPRFFETPLVSFQRMGDSGKIFGVVTVGSGDRSNPLDTEFSNNHLYTFIDKDLARYRSELFCKDDKTTSGDDCAGFALYTENLTPNDLSDIKYTDAGLPLNSGAVKKSIDNSINGQTGTPGWKYKLDDNGFKASLKKDPKGLKLFNRPDALNGQLYTSVFSPEQNTAGEECVATVTGETNRERLCLPYGYCFNKNGTTASRFTMLAGGGIADNYVGFLGGTDGKEKQVGIIDTRDDCTGDDCRQAGGNIETIKNQLTKYGTDRIFNPLRWFNR